MKDSVTGPRTWGGEGLRTSEEWEPWLERRPTCPHSNQDPHKHQQVRSEDVKPVGLLAFSRGYKNRDAGGGEQDK